ncbi:beclin-1-like protein [Leptotrombidium deliense]|uniref:Beclin-1-like protein n=1 Tax=Leptotrombidium deliense TaxID=299467 RepID=A0A443SLD7_9ACAR|nr:beclin-1-like protein [Leptotrombidium deliense]
MESKETAVNFACQRCCQPLKMHSSVLNIDENALKELSDKQSSYDGLRNEFSNKSMSEFENDFKSGVPMSMSIVNGNGFLVVGGMNESMTTSVTGVDAAVDTLNYHLRVTSRLFDILSDQSDVHHPLCEECADFVIYQMDKQLRVLEDECKVYKEFLESLEKSKANNTDGQKSEESLDELRQEIEKLKTEETTLLEQIKGIDEQQKSIEEEIKQQKEELNQMNEEESRYWCEYNNLKKSAFQCEDELQSVDNQLRYAQSQLDKLRKTNVHSGHFGTINGFRLGRLPTAQVEWSEINAAWGQCVLLLHSLAKKMNLTFKRYKLVPYGNHSFLESLDDKSKELPLYGSGGFRFFWNAKFDQAMVAFLDCLQQFREEMLKEDSTFCLPYRMEKGKIEDTKTNHSYSIKIQFNSEEEWTKALKFMLTNLKWILAWVSSRY